MMMKFKGKMMKNQKLMISLVTASLLFSAAALAGEVGSMNTFSAGTPAVAADVNANFGEQTAQINDNNSRIAALEATIVSLQATIATLQSGQSDINATVTAVENSVGTIATSNVMALEPYVSLNGSNVVFSGVNLQVVNGLGGTDTINGLGNFIVGYDEVNTQTGTLVCSLGEYNDADSCIINGHVWSNSHKTGSHNLVGGYMNSYSSYGGFVVGKRNYITNFYSSVSANTDNIASGRFSSISGGYENTASGTSSSISGGLRNTASGAVSSVSGGRDNNASGYGSSISGGISLDAITDYGWRAGTQAEQ